MGVPFPGPARHIPAAQEGSVCVGASGRDSEASVVLSSCLDLAEEKSARSRE